MQNVLHSYNFELLINKIMKKILVFFDLKLYFESSAIGFFISDRVGDVTNRSNIVSIW